VDRQRLLATDLDGTFIGDHGAMEGLWRDLEAAGILVAFSTGRHLESVHDFYAAARTDKRALACVCMVGTEIWLLDGGRYTLDAGWAAHVSASWDRTTVEDVMSGVEGVVAQPDEWQSGLKASYFLDRPSDAPVDDIVAQLAAEHIDANIVYSGGRFLDILPSRAGKGSAVAWLARQLGIRPSEIVVAGDSGNDLDMMRPDLGFSGIVVANASDELARHRAPRVYHAAASHAAGIREGLVRLGWLTA
jgi:sucrose-phosphate synthase